MLHAFRMREELEKEAVAWKKYDDAHALLLVTEKKREKWREEVLG